MANNCATILLMARKDIRATIRVSRESHKRMMALKPESMLIEDFLLICFNCFEQTNKSVADFWENLESSAQDAGPGFVPAGWAKLNDAESAPMKDIGVNIRLFPPGKRHGGRRKGSKDSYKRTVRKKLPLVVDK